MYSSAFFSASSLTAASPCGTLVASALIVLPRCPELSDACKKAPLRCRSEASYVCAPLPLLQLDALLGEVLDRARMPRNRRGGGLLVLELEVRGFLVHRDQRRLLV